MVISSFHPICILGFASANLFLIGPIPRDVGGLQTKSKTTPYEKFKGGDVASKGIIGRGRGLLWRGVKVMIGMRGGDLTRTADDLSQTHTPDIVGRSYLVALYLDHSGSAEPKCAAPTPWSTSGAAGRLSGASRM